MRIGIDIDGVLTDIEQWELDYLSKYYLESYNKYIKNPKGYGSYQIFEGTIEEDSFLWNKAIHEYIKEPPRKFASEVIKKIKLYIRLRKTYHKLKITKLQNQI